jgi:hypothetical protein
LACGERNENGGRGEESQANGDYRKETAAVRPRLVTRGCPESRDKGKQRELEGCRFKRRGRLDGVGKEIRTERAERPEDGEQQ